MTSLIHPVLLCGGSGERLWPLSRASKPKQFLNFSRERSLLQNTVLRCRGARFDPHPIIIGANDHRFLLVEDLAAVQVKADILLEPLPRNSCAAIAAGCLHALTRSREAIVLVLAADHHIPDADSFTAAVAAGVADALSGKLVTFGVRPTRPATSYGYIYPGAPLTEAFAVARFVEKPNAAQAKRYVEEGYLWNSGNFLFRADVFIEELERLAPDVINAVRSAYAKAEIDLGFLRLDEAAFAEAPSIAVDYAVMEKTDQAAVLPVDYAWSDVGSWDSVASILVADSTGNTVVGNTVIVDGVDNIVHSTDRLTALLGLSNLVVVSTRDSLLVASKSRAEDVKNLVGLLHTEGRAEAIESLQIFRPWGNYERLDIGVGYQVKRVTIAPGGVLSLQKHRRRAEHWVVVKGVVEATIGEEVSSLQPGQSIFVPLGAVHRLANRGAEPVIIIEVQTGDYLGEDDIIRIEDVYNRDSLPTSNSK